jgi:hypothetical protein
MYMMMRQVTLDDSGPPIFGLNPKVPIYCSERWKNFQVGIQTCPFPSFHCEFVGTLL